MPPPWVGRGYARLEAASWWHVAARPPLEMLMVLGIVPVAAGDATPALLAATGQARARLGHAGQALRRLRADASDLHSFEPAGPAWNYIHRIRPALAGGPRVATLTLKGKGRL